MPLSSWSCTILAFVVPLNVFLRWIAIASLLPTSTELWRTTSAPVADRRAECCVQIYEYSTRGVTISDERAPTSDINRSYSRSRWNDEKEK
jgi:hypothetical protein